MSRPVILAVDDDPQVLAAVTRDLRTRYAEDYQIISAGSGTEALDAVHEISERGRTIASFLVDQRMPTMSGTEFLLEAQRTFPEAKRLLLTAYADTEAAIQAINEVGLDQYLMKPWTPPDEKLYPILDDALDDWQANAQKPFEGARVFGTTWSPTTYEIKAFLARNEVPYLFIDIDRDEEGAETAAEAADDSTELPIVLLQDNTVFINPDKTALAEAVGIHTAPESPFYDLIVVGGGPAGLAASVYGASEGLSTVMIEREAPGGQAGTSNRIENYLGFPKGLSGADLARRAIAQATRLGAELITAAEVDRVEVSGPLKKVHLVDGSELTCRALIIASGMAVRRLNVPGYQQFEGAGIYYGAAATEASTYKDQHVFVIGGANSAGQAAVMFSKTSSKVTMIVRAGNLGDKMSAYLVDQIGAIDNIEVLTSTSVAEVTGTDRVGSIRLENLDSGDQETRDASALFIFVGAVPHSDFLEGAVEKNSKGFIYTGTDVQAFTDAWPLDRDPLPLETSVPGVFAAGDVREGAVRRVASAVGEGSIAVSFVHRYLDTV
ncbi:MAG: FAD-dependent oxidoreductase [Acidimicrobiia bacterium]|nr:MAG: FAD-dependent oxidoreductase [Acidimicrobiia bacterium]